MLELIVLSIAGFAGLLLFVRGLSSILLFFINLYNGMKGD